MAWHSGRTSVSGRRTFPVLRSTCSWWVTTNVGTPSAIGQPTRPTQPFILSGSIKWVVSWNQMCAAVYRWRHLVRATKVNAGLAESNGRLLLGIWRDSLHVTCGLTACTPGSAPGPTLGNEYGETLPFLPIGRRVAWPTAVMTTSETATLWNNLPSDVVLSPSVNCFRTRVSAIRLNTITHWVPPQISVSNQHVCLYCSPAGFITLCTCSAPVLHHRQSVPAPVSVDVDAFN